MTKLKDELELITMSRNGVRVTNLDLIEDVGEVMDIEFLHNLAKQRQSKASRQVGGLTLESSESDSD